MQKASTHTHKKAMEWECGGINSRNHQGFKQWNSIATEKVNDENNNERNHQKTF